MTILVYTHTTDLPHSVDAAPVMFLSFGKIKDVGQVIAAARHNKRTGGANWRRADCIDACRSHRNYVLYGPPTAEEVRRLVKQELATVRRKIRDGTILVVEVVVSLPVGSPIDSRAYFSAALLWVATDFAGSAVVISADVHHDEGAPHMHVFVVPLVGGRLNGHALIGGPPKLSWWLDQFHAEVASKFGLARRRGDTKGRPKNGIAISCARGAQPTQVRPSAAPARRTRDADEGTRTETPSAALAEEECGA